MNVSKNLLAAATKIKKYDGTANGWRAYKQDCIAIMESQDLYGIVGLLEMNINAKDIFTSYPYNPKPQLVAKIGSLSESAHIFFKPDNNLTLEELNISGIKAGADEADDVYMVLAAA